MYPKPYSTYLRGTIRLWGRGVGMVLMLAEKVAWKVWYSSHQPQSEFLKCRLYRGLYRRPLQGCYKGDTRSSDYSSHEKYRNGRADMIHTMLVS